MPARHRCDHAFAPLLVYCWRWFHRFCTPPSFSSLLTCVCSLLLCAVFMELDPHCWAASDLAPDGPTKQCYPVWHGIRCNTRVLKLLWRLGKRQACTVSTSLPNVCQLAGPQSVPLPSTLDCGPASSHPNLRPPCTIPRFLSGAHSLQQGVGTHAVGAPPAELGPAGAPAVSRQRSRAQSDAAGQEALSISLWTP